MQDNRKILLNEAVKCFCSRFGDDISKCVPTVTEIIEHNTVNGIPTHVLEERLKRQQNSILKRTE
jgi:hypothetical protein